MFEDSMIRKTGQWWKWRLGQGIQLAGYFFWFISGVLYFFPRDTADLQVLMTLIGMLLVLSGMTFLWTSIKCPLCKSKWLWLEASKRDIFNFKKWGPSMPSSEICPECKNTGIKKSPKIYNI
ncbi:MAG: hypothetical protein EHM45_16460 [Desulfobacteraceae bacterium]|nr:MAG: hypothetical protein EHM45_16460 [Desulfobacteraceae bacterium]